MNISSESVAIPVEKGAPVWRRLAALFYDVLLLTALSMAYGAIAVLVHVLVTGDRGEAYTPMFEGTLFPLGWLALIAGFYCFFWYRGGQTLGMRAWRLRLQGETGQPVTLKQCFLRCLAGPLALGLGGIGYWWALLDPEHACLHDRASHTRVTVIPKRT